MTHISIITGKMPHILLYLIIETYVDVHGLLQQNKHDNTLEIEIRTASCCFIPEGSEEVRTLYLCPPTLLRFCYENEQSFPQGHGSLLCGKLKHQHPLWSQEFFLNEFNQRARFRCIFRTRLVRRAAKRILVP